MRNKKIISKERLKHLVIYNKKTGKFYWALRDKRNNNEIKIKYDVMTGYPYIYLDAQFYYLYELAYLYVLGYFPEERVTHKNEHKDDVRWKNIEEDNIKRTLSKLTKKELDNLIAKLKDNY